MTPRMRTLTQLIALVALSTATVACGGSKKDAAEPNRQRYEQLTPRERDVLRLIAQGYSAPEIGSQLGISPKTVDTYKQRIEEKLGLAHRSDYVQFAFTLGLLGKS